MQQVVARVREVLYHEQQRQKQVADRFRSDRSFSVGDQVWVSVKGLRFPFVSSVKLTKPYVGPFEVVQCMRNGAYKLKLPPTMKCHNVFNIDRLFPYEPPMCEHQDVLHPDPVLRDPIHGDEFEVEALLDRKFFGRGNGKHLRYLVRWVGYGPEHDKWVALADLQCDELLQEYNARFPLQVDSRRMSRRIMNRKK
jgi:Chromo (CHRromatin Organisation MOdifier) domain